MNDQVYAERVVPLPRNTGGDARAVGGHVQVPPRELIVATGMRLPAGDAWAPVADVIETDDAVAIELELPGVTADQIQIDVVLHQDQDSDATASALVVSGHRDPRSVGKKVLTERQSGPFRRSFSLPAGYAGDRAVSVLAEGLLTIMVPYQPPAPEAASRRVVRLAVTAATGRKDDLSPAEAS